MKVAELEGALLDAWVARADGETLASAHKCADLVSGRYWLKMGDYGSVKECPRYSTDWAHGGPIIERHNITLLDPNYCNSGQWEAYMGAFPDVRDDRVVGMVAAGAGPTPLIAAMRAYVVSKFGDEVPDMADAQPGSTG